jgi:DHA2 family multidrug resistance protein
VLCTLGILIFIRQTRYVHREPFDFVGFLTLSLGIGALQLMLDRGELKDWFHSSEIWIEATVAGLGFYLFTVHTVTTDERSFLNRDLLKSANFVAGTLLMFCGGLIMTGTLALLPTMLQNLMNYPALTTGMVTMPRGIGSMAAMFLVAPCPDGETLAGTINILCSNRYTDIDNGATYQSTRLDITAWPDQWAGW